MPSTPSEKDLKAAISSTLRRQHLLGTVPGAQRFIPITALAIGDFVARRSQGENLVEELLCGKADAEVYSLAGPVDPENGVGTLKSRGIGGLGFSSALVDACLNCSTPQPRGKLMNTGFSLVPLWALASGGVATGSPSTGLKPHIHPLD